MATTACTAQRTGAGGGDTHAHTAGDLGVTLSSEDLALHSEAGWDEQSGRHGWSAMHGSTCCVLAVLALGGKVLRIRKRSACC